MKRIRQMWAHVLARGAGPVKRIRQMWAYVALDDDGAEGVIAFMEPVSRQWFPLVAADRERIDSLKPVAQRVATEGQRQIRLVRFDRRREIETIYPTKEPA